MRLGCACRPPTSVSLGSVETPYTDLGADFYTRRDDPERQTRRLIAKLQALGHKVTLEPAA
jgi:hypothetical protein